MKTIRIGSRESRLAVVQSQIVMEGIRRRHPDINLELVTMKTTGDRILNKSLDKIGGKGLFVKELDEALSSGRVDLCVHSYKDMPAQDSPELPVVAVSPREDARDVLILPAGDPDAALRRDRPMGCSSLRRRLQWGRLFPDWEVAPVRGNVLTRLEKLDRGEYGGLVLAAAGVRRLGLWDRVSRVFTVEELLPCSCQGVLAVQAHRDNREIIELLRDFHDADAWDVAVAERAFIRVLDGGCSSPAAAYGELLGEELVLHGLYADEEGRLFRGSIRGDRSEGVRLGSQLAIELKTPRAHNE